ncbi:MAG: hypothetical protein J0L69_04550 [Bacteroidetes bacterium]|nr:hypothetical protein [Bacteroidota bacterium]
MTKSKLDKTFGAITFLLIICATVVTFTSNKVSLTINVWQASINDGKYYPTLSVLLIVLPFLLMMLPIKILLLKRIKKNENNLEDLRINNK